MAMNQLLHSGARASTAVPAEDTSILTVLHEDALQQVLQAAKAAKVLGLLASSSRQLCNFARSRVPLYLNVCNQERAGLVIRSHACSRPPFSGCTELFVSAGDAVMCCLAQGVLNAAQQWTGLRQLQLYIPTHQQDRDCQEYCVSSLLSGVPLLRQLRCLELSAMAGMGVCCARHFQELTRLRVTAPASSADAAADLVGLSRLTNLVHLHLDWALAPHLPAGPEGPFCLPSNLVDLELSSTQHTSPAPMACWLPHLCGCPQLQHLTLAYGPQQHASAHPSTVVGLLAQHTPQLRSLHVWSPGMDITWGAPIAALPPAAEPVAREWRPDAALAALRGLEGLTGGGFLCMRHEADWQHLVQVTALTRLAYVCVSGVPEVQAGSTLAVLELDHCYVELGGYDVGRLLLACPSLQQATIYVMGAAVVTAGPRLLPHPKLRRFNLMRCCAWGDPAQAVAHFAALVPVIAGVSSLSVRQWFHGSSFEGSVLPDLSLCTAVTALAFSGRDWPQNSPPHLEQESILSMVAPLKQLQRLKVADSPRVNARIVLVLQSMLPQLQHVDLEDCGRLLPADDPSSSGYDPVTGEEDAQEVLACQGVLRLLRPDLTVEVSGYCT